MIFVLVVFLFIELIVAYCLNGKRLFSPSFVSISVFLVSSLVYAFFMNSLFGTDIHLVTAIAIPATMAFVIAGEIMANKVKKKQHNFGYKEVKALSINLLVIILFSIFVLAVSIWYAYDVYLFSLSLGNSKGSFFSATEFVRHSSSYGDGNSFYSSGTLLNQALLISKCILYLCFFAFMNDSLLKRKPQIRYLFPFFGYIVYIAFCDSRGYLIQDILIFISMVFNRLSFFRFSRRKMNKIVLITTVSSLAFFLLSFRILGFRTGTSLNKTFLFNIAEYISSGILGLDKVLISGFDSNSLFAQGVLRNIYIKLNDFGFGFRLGPSNREFFTYLAGRSNVYTGLLTLIMDFGVFCCFFLFVWSFFLQVLLNNKKPNNELLYCFVVGTLFYPLSMISIGGEWANVLSVTTIYHIVYLLLLESFFLKKRNLKSKGELNAKRIQDCSSWRGI